MSTDCNCWMERATGHHPNCVANERQSKKYEMPCSGCGAMMSSYNGYEWEVCEHLETCVFHPENQGVSAWLLGDVPADPEYNTKSRRAARIRAMAGHLNKEILATRSLGNKVTVRLKGEGDEKLIAVVADNQPGSGV